MSIKINVHFTRTITARADHNGETHWTDVFFTASDDTLRVTAFFDTAEAADKYAAAINGANAAPVEPVAEAGNEQTEPEENWAGVKKGTAASYGPAPAEAAE